MNPRAEGLFSSENTAMRALLETAGRLGERPDTPVLLQGEVGTGKELLARFVHGGTPSLRGKPFVKVTCAGAEEEPLAAEMFGTKETAGALEQASGGTLFLEDVSELPARLQLELLRALKTGRFRRLEGSADLVFSVRVMAATSLDLARAARKGLFRSDLFHRLDVVRLALPPLRQRREDVLPLAHWFLAQLAKQWVRPLPRLTRDAEVALLAHDWPGNVRELRNAIEAALIAQQGEEIDAAALPLGRDGKVEGRGPFFEVQIGPDEPPPSMAEIERLYIEAVLRRAGGNRSEASRVLGLSYPTVTRKIAEYGIKLP